MNRYNIFMYGLLTGAIVVLSAALMMQSGNGPRLQAQGAMSSDNVALATGNTQSNESILWVVTDNPAGENMVLLGYFSNRAQPSLLLARNMKWDRQLFDLVAPRGGSLDEVKKGEIPVEALKNQMEED